VLAEAPNGELEVLEEVGHWGDVLRAMGYWLWGWIPVRGHSFVWNYETHSSSPIACRPLA
jgi:hypothetical protein